jgi:hypothetical protein
MHLTDRVCHTFSEEEALHVLGHVLQLPTCSVYVSHGWLLHACCSEGLLAVSTAVLEFTQVFAVLL